MLLKYPMLLRPVSREIMWGGSTLKEKYHKTAPFDKLAESWELTVRPDEINVIDNGEYTGIPLEDYIVRNRTSILGINGAKYDRFPLLIKFIDAADRLSIQVHPDDDYAIAHEGEFGKTEMWYIMDAKPGAKLVYGLREGCTADGFAKAVSTGRTDEMLHYVDVHPGEVYFIPAGQVHAIGAGILIAEIQQNSNVTYRVYDYNRRQADGSLRVLHTEKALDVIRIRTDEEIEALRFSGGRKENGYELLCNCAYFNVRRYTTGQKNVAFLEPTDRSFLSLLVLEAGDDAILESGDFSTQLIRGQSYFIPAETSKIKISGSTVFLSTTVK